MLDYDGYLCQLVRRFTFKPTLICLIGVNNLFLSKNVYLT